MWGFGGGTGMAMAILVALIQIGHSCDATMIDAGFDPAMNPQTLQLLQSDLQKIDKMQLQVEPNSSFHKVFGSVDASGLIPYLNDRIHYVIPLVRDLASRILIGGESYGASSADDGPDVGSSGLLMALNIGVGLWLMNETSTQPLRFQIGDSSVSLDSARVGIVELGRGYTEKETSSGAPIGVAARTATLIHEARHSDCSGGPLKTDLTRIKNGDAPLNHKCGYVHAECPEGHSLAGLPACDDLAWGSYSVQGVFAAAMAANCSDCDEVTKQQALANSVDAFSRVLVLNEMLAGHLGDPDMSSSDEAH